MTDVHQFGPRTLDARVAPASHAFEVAFALGSSGPSRPSGCGSIEKVSKNHFLSIYGPFSSIFRGGGWAENPASAALEPFSSGATPLRNGENGENGEASSALALRRARISSLLVVLTESEHAADNPMRCSRRSA